MQQKMAAAEIKMAEDYGLISPDGKTPEQVFHDNFQEIYTQYHLKRGAGFQSEKAQFRRPLLKWKPLLQDKWMVIC